MAGSEEGKYIIVGRVTGVYGVRGWVKIRSHTAPVDNILGYSPWYLALAGGWQTRKVVEGRCHGKGMVALLEGCTDRDAALQLMGCDIAVRREQLPAVAADEFYWADLVGLQVINLEGVALGTVVRLFETGANDVVVVQGERERLIPYIAEVVREVDLAGGVLRVDWDAEF